MPTAFHEGALLAMPLKSGMGTLLMLNDRTADFLKKLSNKLCFEAKDLKFSFKQTIIQ